ncbi:glycosyltransferase family 4 protein [Bacillus thuringiensis]|uniref:glycosyltransferase family 4 protein n=1 Tax=Bacillus thuringiensis TaxID=1428 RepID=UPI0021D65FC5|nr:MraY family glycosyltransferase [Bacillus thuringiensis]MCU7666757.1 undecaprenyl/decaprenyl-phosphate alpha-N-acetylglucosaminyl 1-phosphate transferase [Bacillus thuringiensis]
MNMNIWLILLTTVLFGIIATPLVIKFAVKFGFIDKPNERKVHTRIIPRLGGLAIYGSFVLGITLSYFCTDIFAGRENLFFALIIGGTIIAITGIVDDKLELSPMKKFIGQVLAAVTVIAFNIKVVGISNPLSDEIIQLGILAVPITLFWIIGITNAINLVDGLDGLAGGISGIAALSISIIAFLAGQTQTGFMALLLVASLVGFLIFNFHPAKIFMGDVGSMFLGFILSVLTMQELKQITLLGVMVPILLLAIPILDTLYAMIRRKYNHKPLFAPDKHHLHHRLLKRGFSQRKAVLIIYSISLSFATLGILIPFLTTWAIITIFVLLLVIFQYIYNS